MQFDGVQMLHNWMHIIYDRGTAGLMQGTFFLRVHAEDFFETSSFHHILLADEFNFIEELLVGAFRQK